MKFNLLTGGFLWLSRRTLAFITKLYQPESLLRIKISAFEVILSLLILSLGVMQSTDSAAVLATL